MFKPPWSSGMLTVAPPHSTGVSGRPCATTGTASQSRDMRGVAGLQVIPLHCTCRLARLPDRHALSTQRRSAWVQGVFAGHTYHPSVDPSAVGASVHRRYIRPS
eukprot:365203-Chlamydomonas_euryale.AAC.24